MCRSSEAHPADRRAGPLLQLSALVAAAVAVVTACGDEPMTPATPDPPVPTTVAISPASAAFRSIGDTVRMIATVSDQYGQAMADVAVVWNSSDTAVAAVTEGLVTAINNGSATVTAAAGSAVASAGVAVEQLADTVIVTPVSDSVVQGDTLRLSAAAMDGNGHVVTGAEFAWSSSSGSVATVNASGLVRGVAEGTALISVVAGSARGTARIAVFSPDRAVLIAFYEATDGPNWVNNENWLTDALLEDWYGVSTNGDGRVTYLGLDRNGLRGSIPSELGNLASLRNLRLGNNQLTGPIPPELGRLSRLSDLVADRNALTGPIPAELGDTDLEILVLHVNELSGPIPPELGKLTRLRRLWLGNNALTGSIPPELGNTSLELLDLGPNELSGPVPPELGKLTNLERLYLYANFGLRGEIPPDVLALNLDVFWSWATRLCVPRTGDFESYISKDGWAGYACGEAEPGFQIQLLFDPDVPDHIREAMNSQAEYWMEILRDTEAPDLFGTSLCFRADSDWKPSFPPIIDDIAVRVEYGEEPGGVGSCGLVDILRHRIPYWNSVDFGTSRLRDPRLREYLARRTLGHALGFATLWENRSQLGNPSTPDEARDTHAVSPLAEKAFDAAGGTSYSGPKVPVQQHGPCRNFCWRGSVFGPELMSWGGWSYPVPTSAVTLQAFADLGYTVDLSLADPYTLPGAAAVAALGAGAAPFEQGWEAPPSVVLCRPRVHFKEPDGLPSDSQRSGVGLSDLHVDWVDARGTPSADCEDLMRR